MGKVKFELSVEKITFKFEGDQDTGQAVNRAMNHTLGSLIEAQNRVIDITPEPSVPALPAATALPRRRRRNKAKMATNGQPVAQGSPANGDPASGKPVRQRRSHGSSFRDQAYLLIGQGHFSQPRTANELMAELSRRGHHYDPKNVASDLLWLTKKHYLSRNRNEDGKYAYVKGTNNDFPGSSGGA